MCFEIDIRWPSKARAFNIFGLAVAVPSGLPRGVWGDTPQDLRVVTHSKRERLRKDGESFGDSWGVYPQTPRVRKMLKAQAFQGRRKDQKSTRRRPWKAIVQTFVKAIAFQFTATICTHHGRVPTL